MNQYPQAAGEALGVALSRDLHITAEEKASWWAGQLEPHKQAARAHQERVQTFAAETAARLREAGVASNVTFTTNTREATSSSTSFVRDEATVLSRGWLLETNYMNITYLTPEGEIVAAAKSTAHKDAEVPECTSRCDDISVTLDRADGSRAHFNLAGQTDFTYLLDERARSTEGISPDDFDDPRGAIDALQAEGEILEPLYEKLAHYQDQIVLQP